MMNIFNIKNSFASKVAYPGLCVLILLSVMAAIFPTSVNNVLTYIQNLIYRDFSWVYILLVSFFVIFLLLLAVSKMGNIRLGADNSEPQYSFFSWISMLFAAGMGIGLMYFGVAEPMAHYVHPALSDTSNLAKDAQLATFFHWGIHAWSIFALMGLVLAYFSFRYKLPLSIRSGLYPILGDKIYGWVGDVVDIFALVSTFFGISTSLGFGVMQLNAGLVHLNILDDTNFLFQCVIVVVVSFLAVSSAIAGLNKGVKRLSEINLGAAILLMLFVLFLGPTIFLLSAFSEGIGYYIENFASLTFNTFAFEKEGHDWFTSWTVMYWAWWISWAPFVGLFIARISKGRTIREYILAVMLVPSLFIFLWMTIFGNGAIWMDENVAGGALSKIADNPDILMFTFFETLPLAKIICVIAIVMIAIFFITSADSGILVLNSISTGNKKFTPKWQKAFWGILMALITMVLIRVGGLQSLQTMTLISALPFGAIMFILCLCLLYALRTDELYNSAHLPYGSRSWGGEHWKLRLKQIITFHKKSDIKRFFNEKVELAFEELKDEFELYGIQAEILKGKRGPLSVELNIPHVQIRNFRYGVTAEKQQLSDYLIDEENTPDVENGMQYIPTTYYTDGRTGNDIQYLSKEEIIADVLREYDRYINIISDERNAMIFVDKKKSY